MVPWPQLVAFFIASLILIVMPGPSVLFIIGRSLALGRRGGVLSVVGTTLGMIVLVVLVALGLGVIVAQSVVLFTIVKFAGAAYLIWLGIQAIRHRKDAAAAVAAGAAASSTRRLVGEGFVVGVTNPKTIAFFVAVLPQFVDYGAGTIPLADARARRHLRVPGVGERFGVGARRGVCPGLVRPQPAPRRAPLGGRRRHDDRPGWRACSDRLEALRGDPPRMNPRGRYNSQASR